MLCDVLVVGGVSRDTLLQLDQLHYDGDVSNLKDDFIFALGRKIYIQDTSIHYGGGGGNCAVSFAKFGLKTVLMARTGKDENAHLLKQYLKKQRVNTSLLQMDSKQKTAFSIILTTKTKVKDRTILTHRGANASLRVTQKALRRVSPQWIVISTLGTSWEKDLEVLMQTKAKIAWNPGASQLEVGKSLFKKFGRVDLLTLNKQEAAMVLSETPKHIAKPRQMITLLKRIHQLGPRIVAITDGSQGSYLYDGNQLLYANTLHLKKVDITGAGDAFLSGMVAGLQKNLSVEDAFKLANANANHVITVVGAQNGLLNWTQGNSWLKKVQVELL